jgi:dipeptidyl aminopeptidase/acylaminoacyl peptidase
MPDGRHILARRNQLGLHTLWLIDSESGKSRQILSDAPYTSYDQLAVRVSDGRVACIASSTIRAAELITFTIDVPEIRVHSRTFDTVFQPNALSTAQAVSWESLDGAQVYGLYYPPASANFDCEGLPPLIVYMHGGPTSQRWMRFEPDMQYWATRGYAVLAVNFRGSTGYGREYMQALDGRWGEIDLMDAVSAADQMGNRGLADRAKCIIMGGSSGGYNVLQALVSYPGAFAAGVCLYGISDQFALVRDTHKFEAHYSDTLLGKLPEAADLYRERSPLLHVERINDPLIVFQGQDDTVVPQNQSDDMVAALRARGVAVEYHVYEGEGHGFRKAETISHYLNSTQAFLERTIIYA